jgi:hypothetical protein
MLVKFVTQPFEDGTDLRDFIHSVSVDPELNSLSVIVAWAKRSGLRRIQKDLEAFSLRGGCFNAIVGVSEGGATRQGLEALIALADQAHVFHDAGRTFHPKIYLAEGPDKGLLLIGSHNLTAGGLAWNHEAGLWCELDLRVEADRKLRDQVAGYFARLLADSSICLPLDGSLLVAMLAEVSLKIQDEDKSQRPPVHSPDAPEESDSAAPGAGSGHSLFGKSSEKKRTAPVITGPLQATPGASKTKTKPAATTVPTKRATSVSPGTTAIPNAAKVTKRWFKLLDGTAAQQPPGAKTNPTGNLRLSQEDFAIDHTKYFRQVFFAGLAWNPRPKDPRFDTVHVPMSVSLDGVPQGVMDFEISHAPHRLSGQGNVTTVLHWKPLSATLRATSYVGRFVTLERRDDGTFALTIDKKPMGGFVY